LVLFMVFRVCVLSRWAFPFDSIDVCTTSYHVVCLTYCVLDFDGPINFASRSGVEI
jgi:hypothetical protein